MIRLIGRLSRGGAFDWGDVQTEFYAGQPPALAWSAFVRTGRALVAAGFVEGDPGDATGTLTKAGRLLLAGPVGIGV